MYKLLYFAVKFYIFNYSDFDKLLLLCISHNLQDCTQLELRWHLVCDVFGSKSPKGPPLLAEALLAPRV